MPLTPTRPSSGRLTGKPLAQSSVVIGNNFNSTTIAAPVYVSGTASTSTVSPWVQVAASVGVDLYLSQVNLYQYSQGYGYLLQLGVGAAGAETVVGEVAFVPAAQDKILLPVPIRVTAGSRIAARVANYASSNQGLGFWLMADVVQYLES